MALSPRLNWSFGGVLPSQQLLQVLHREGLTSGPLLADAFVTLEQLEGFAESEEMSAQIAEELAKAWSRARTALPFWLQPAKRSRPVQLSLPLAATVHSVPCAGQLAFTIQCIHQSEK